MKDSQLVAAEWVVPASLKSETRADLEQWGAKLQQDEASFTPPPGQEAEYSEASFEPLIVIAGLMSLAMLARRVLSLIKDARYDGIIVDARTEPVQIRPHPSLDRGDLLVITGTGSQYLQRTGDASDLTAILQDVKGG